MNVCMRDWASKLILCFKFYTVQFPGLLAQWDKFPPCQQALRYSAPPPNVIPHEKRR